MFRSLCRSVVAVSFSLALYSGVAGAAPGELRGARVAAGQISAEGEGYVAGTEGATLALDYGARMKIKKGTRFEMGRTMKLAVGSGPDPLVLGRVINVPEGWVEAQVPEHSRFAILIIGPRDSRAIVVPGGRMTVIATEPRVTIATHKRDSLVGIKDKWRKLAEASVFTVDEARPEGARREMLGAAQTPVLTRSLLLAGEGADATTFVAWPAVPGVDHYQVELASPDGSVRTLRSAEPRMMLSSLPVGHFDLSVQGMDESGLSGGKSPSVALNVVGLSVPSTASVGSDGTYKLQPGQRIKLNGAEGLEVGYVGLEEFLPAPDSLGLVARRPISLVLKHPHSGETLPLKLAPLEVKAEIAIAKHPAEWPSDGLEVNVKLRDAQGDAVSEAFAASCRVTVNVEPVTPEWRREGSMLRAVLPRPAKPGPWMVRVDVLDESGSSLGMDLAEVGYQSSQRQAATKSR